MNLFMGQVDTDEEILAQIKADEAEMEFRRMLYTPPPTYEHPAEQVAPDPVAVEPIAPGGDNEVLLERAYESQGLEYTPVEPAPDPYVDPLLIDWAIEQNLIGPHVEITQGLAQFIEGEYWKFKEQEIDRDLAALRTDPAHDLVVDTREIDPGHAVVSDPGPVAYHPAEGPPDSSPWPWDPDKKVQYAPEPGYRSDLEAKQNEISRNEIDQIREDELERSEAAKKNQLAAWLAIGAGAFALLS